MTAIGFLTMLCVFESQQLRICLRIKLCWDNGEVLKETTDFS